MKIVVNSSAVMHSIIFFITKNFFMFISTLMYVKVLEMCMGRRGRWEVVWKYIRKLSGKVAHTCGIIAYIRKLSGKVAHTCGITAYIRKFPVKFAFSCEIIAYIRKFPGKMAHTCGITADIRKFHGKVC